MTDQSITTTFRFPKQLRLLQRSHYSLVFNKGKAYRTDDLFCRYCANNKGYPRLGLAIAKKKVPKAVARQRIKRLIREAFRLRQHQIVNMDIVIMSNASITGKTNYEIINQINQLLDITSRKLLSKG